MTTTSSTDLHALVQQTIDLEPLQPYYHTEIADRKPLVISTGPAIDREWELMKFGVPVRFLPESELAGRPYLKFDQITVTGDQATVKFTYPVEGIRGTVTFVKANGQWRVQSQQIVET